MSGRDRVQTQNNESEVAILKQGSKPCELMCHFASFRVADTAIFHYQEQIHVFRMQSVPRGIAYVVYIAGQHA